MKKISTILVILILSSCAASEREALRASEKMERPNDLSAIEYELAEDQLSPEAIKSFESKVIAQFKELLEYFKLASQQDLNADFRKTAVTTIGSYLIKNPNESNTPSDKEIDEILSKNLLSDTSGNYKLVKGFEKEAASYYQGILQFETGEPRQLKEIPVYLIKLKKQFGSETHEVWEIKFVLI